MKYPSNNSLNRFSLDFMQAHALPHYGPKLLYIYPIVSNILALRVFEIRRFLSPHAYSPSYTGKPVRRNSRTPPQDTLKVPFRGNVFAENVGVKCTRENEIMVLCCDGGT
jgi:hypothetical protein